MGRYEMVLLDTCAIIWDALEPSKLTQKAKKAIKADQNLRDATLVETILVKGITGNRERGSQRQRLVRLSNLRLLWIRL